MKNGQPTTHAIANKGFSGLRSSSPASSFVSVDSFSTPQSLTAHSLTRYAQPAHNTNITAMIK
jgi:hypothetical protein